MSEPAPLYLVADVGGTNTRVALADGSNVRTGTIDRFRNADFAGLEPILAAYLATQGSPEIRGVAVDVAGPVRDGVGRMTNLDWTITRDALTAATGAERAVVLNDLQAQGHALGRIAPEMLRTIVPGPAPVAHSARLVIGVGTGFNAAPVYDTETGRYVPPSEAGHVTLPIRNEDDHRLWQFIEETHGFPAVEDVLSGRGLERVYAWCTHGGSGARKSAAEIMQSCASGDDPVALAAAGTFVRMLGTVAGNLALIHLPFGGVYLIGGVARAMMPYFERFDFAGAFRDKGRFAGFMESFPVHLLEDDYAALTGLAAHIDN